MIIHRPDGGRTVGFRIGPIMMFLNLYAGHVLWRIDLSVAGETWDWRRRKRQLRGKIAKRKEET